jgi:hypothetical protein
MDDDQIPIGIITEELLPDDLRTELCIARVTIADNHKLLRFRIDPGSAFERRALPPHRGQRQVPDRSR